MKKIIYTIALLIASHCNFAQTVTINTDKETYTVSGAYYFTITKTDKKTGKAVYKAETNIPDKKAGEGFNAGANNASFELVGDNIIIVYDVWQKSTNTKDCSIKLMNTKTGKLNTSKVLFSAKLNSFYSSHEVPMKPFYSPDKTKLAILKDNISLSYDINAEIMIYDTKTLNLLKTKNLGQKYDGHKRIFDLSQFKVSNEGNVSLMFSLMNEETKMTTKSYSANIPYESAEMKDIKELAGNASGDEGGSTTSNGRFYKTVDDYINDKPIAGVRIKNGSFSWTAVTGTKFKLIDDEGNLKKESAGNLPSEIFTYKSDNFSDPFLMRIIDGKPYIVLAVGKYNFYSLYSEQDKLYFSDGWNSDLEKFREGKLSDLLEKNGLLEAYKKDAPKREARDSVNGYFNKQVSRYIKYFRLLNEKMK